MPNQFITAERAAKEIAEVINRAAAGSGVSAYNLARLFGYSIGAPVDVCDLVIKSHVNQGFRG
jgi:hypothetical protein